MSSQSNYLQNRAIFFILLIGFYLISNYLLDNQLKEFDSQLTRILSPLTLLLLREFLSDSKKVEEKVMNYDIQNAVKKEFEELNNHFKRGLTNDDKSGIVAELYDQNKVIQSQLEILEGHFADGGIIPKLSEKIGALEGHFIEGGVVVQILDQLKAIREENSPNKRREKSR